MVRIPDSVLWDYINQDLPYLDLTTRLLGLARQSAALEIITRHRIIASCTAEAARVAELLGCYVSYLAEDGKYAEEGQSLIRMEGDHESLHSAWRLVQILLEYACGMATYAAAMREKIQAVNPRCELLVTRKNFPFARRFSIQAMLSGGVFPHRLGLSETVLVFEQHRAMYKSKEDFEDAFRKLKLRCTEKKLVTESGSEEDAKRMLELGADVIQLDRCSAETVKNVVNFKTAFFPDRSVLAAGGISLTNAEHYAETGVDGIVTSSPYQAAPADLTAEWKTIY